MDVGPTYTQEEKTTGAFGRRERHRRLSGRIQGERTSTPWKPGPISYAVEETVFLVGKKRHQAAFTSLFS